MVLSSLKLLAQPETEAEVTSHFLTCHNSVMRGVREEEEDEDGPDSACTSRRAAAAGIVVKDPFPRNEKIFV